MTQLKRHISSLDRLPLVAGILAGLYASPGMAQTAQEAAIETSTEERKEKQATELDAVSVTGSLLRRADSEGTSPIQTIDVAESAAQGNTNLAQVLQRTAVGASSTQITNQFGSFVVNGGLGVQTIALRGLGANRTLVLLNGQRPGPAGVQGAVSGFDLNVIPTAILGRIDIVKDGSSSIYGSDAVAGTVNLITRRDIAKPELTVSSHIPLAGGGETFDISLVNGWSFGSGNIIAAASIYRQNALQNRDRDFLACSESRVFGKSGERIDIQDHSILKGTHLAGCQNLYHNAVNEVGTATTYVPSPDGVTIGPFPGYRPNVLRRHADGVQAASEEVQNFERFGESDVISTLERATLFLGGDVSLGEINWKSHWLLNRREAKSQRWQQFFPQVPFDGMRFGMARPLMPLMTRANVEVTYFFGANKFDGLVRGTDTWAWEANANYSRSSGVYSSEAIETAKTGDRQFPGSGSPAANYRSRIPKRRACG